MDKNFEEILYDKIIKYEDLNQELSLVFNKIGIPFDGKLKIFKKKVIGIKITKNSLIKMLGK